MLQVIANIQAVPEAERRRGFAAPHPNADCWSDLDPLSASAV